jgi:hypothetical protein
MPEKSIIHCPGEPVREIFDVVNDQVLIVQLPG